MDVQDYDGVVDVIYASLKQTESDSKVREIMKFLSDVAWKCADEKPPKKSGKWDLPTDKLVVEIGPTRGYYSGEHLTPGLYLCEYIEGFINSSYPVVRQHLPVEGLFLAEVTDTKPMQVKRYLYDTNTLLPVELTVSGRELKGNFFLRFHCRIDVFVPEEQE